MTGLVAAVLVLASCSGDGASSRGRPITIPDLTGMDRARAVSLIDGLDLDIQVQEIDVTDAGAASAPPGVVRTGSRPGTIVVRQDPAPGTEVEPGSTITLYVPRAAALRQGEKRFKLLTHCGLGYPMVFEGRAWLPVDPKLRRTMNPPQGFASHGFYDIGTIRRVDADSLIYTSSAGIEVEYEPSDRPPQGCD